MPNCLLKVINSNDNVPFCIFCIAGYFIYEGKCRKCISSCNTCIDREDLCTSCPYD